MAQGALRRKLVLAQMDQHVPPGSAVEVSVAPLQKAPLKAAPIVFQKPTVTVEYAQQTSGGICTHVRLVPPVTQVNRAASPQTTVALKKLQVTVFLLVLHCHSQC